MARRRSRRYSRWDWYPKPSQPRPADGIKAKSRRGKIGETWWADKWIAALEPLMDSGRLRRGKSYARRGQVLDIDIGPGEVRSRVQGSRRTPYRVTINVKTLSDAEWDKVIDAMAEQAIFAAKLLAGEMPPDIEEAFWAAHVSLFPRRRDDLQTDCSCPDWANPCKHIAAVYYLLGERFDEDPFLIFQLRGRDKEQLLAELRARRSEALPAIAEEAPSYEIAGLEEQEQAKPLEEALDHFWEPGEGLDDFQSPITAPQVEAALLKRLGKPPFERRPGEVTRALATAYAAATQSALRIVLGDDSSDRPQDA